MIMMRASKSAAFALACSSEVRSSSSTSVKQSPMSLRGGSVELDVELAQLGLEVRRGQRVEHLRVERHRIARSGR